jgi:hypothetical protein
MKWVHTIGLPHTIPVIDRYGIYILVFGASAVFLVVVGMALRHLLFYLALVMAETCHFQPGLPYLLLSALAISALLRLRHNVMGAGLVA